jgi:hypothetical protein
MIFLTGCEIRDIPVTRFHFDRYRSFFCLKPYTEWLLPHSVLQTQGTIIL